MLDEKFPPTTAIAGFPDSEVLVQKAAARMAGAGVGDREMEGTSGLEEVCRGTRKARLIATADIESQLGEVDRGDRRETVRRATVVSLAEDEVAEEAKERGTALNSGDPSLFDESITNPSAPNPAAPTMFPAKKTSPPDPDPTVATSPRTTDCWLTQVDEVVSQTANPPDATLLELELAAKRVEKFPLTKMFVPETTRPVTDPSTPPPSDSQALVEVSKDARRRRACPGVAILVNSPPT